VDGGHAIGQVAGLSDGELQELARAPLAFGNSSRPEPGPGAANANLQSLLDAVAAFDYSATNEELSRLALLLSPTGIVHQVVLPLMRLAGENWENGTFQIAQEHMLSACLRNLLGGLMRLEKPGNGALRILFTTPSGELHEFGILAAAMLAVAQGLQVTYLGPNLPAGEILSAAEKCAASAVVLGIMKSNATPAVKTDMTRLASELPFSTELWAGGPGATEAFAGLTRSGIYTLEDFVDFEWHLSRLRAAPVQGPTR